MKKEIAYQVLNEIRKLLEVEQRELSKLEDIKHKMSPTNHTPKNISLWGTTPRGR